MGCSSGGCSSGSCSSGCGTMNVSDWLSKVTMPGNAFDIVEVKFKGGRKEYFRNTNNLVLNTGDPVVIEAHPGHHVGYVSAQGEIVRFQLKKKRIANNDDIRIIYRIATDKDLEKFKDSSNREMPTIFKGREIIKEHKLSMKLSDVEYQADNTKATFFYSSDERVDFRELIKRLASEFKIRVEMRQISMRQEAGRLGGIGSCGRELCCSTWLTDFKSVSTSAARYQNLSLNPAKLSGQCGRLKCCLNYELDTYMDALKSIPNFSGPLKTRSGKAFLQKTDIFNQKMWFNYEGENDWIEVPAKRVKEVLALVKDGNPPYSLLRNEDEVHEPIEVVNKDLNKLDQKLKKKSNSRKKNFKPRKNNKK